MCTKCVSPFLYEMMMKDLQDQSPPSAIKQEPDDRWKSIYHVKHLSSFSLESASCCCLKGPMKWWFCTDISLSHPHFLDVLCMVLFILMRMTFKMEARVYLFFPDDEVWQPCSGHNTWKLGPFLTGCMSENAAHQRKRLRALKPNHLKFY